MKHIIGLCDKRLQVYYIATYSCNFVEGVRSKASKLVRMRKKRRDSCVVTVSIGFDRKQVIAMGSESKFSLSLLILCIQTLPFIRIDV